MQPVSPIVPGLDLKVTIIAKNQQPYLPVPAHIMDDGAVLIRWHLSWYERIKLLFTGNLWHWVLTFHDKLQPIKLTVNKPKAV